ncbi:hypothetical protein CDAR_186441 [Caerostris darwini]|uniref:Uncharacterized protein n=1 Tax=Caerostris darwini TaxID=1538125 RepID=A0AAV4V1M4_9ARAC|nr:hypothetical protein CDAR_186441 [Caerostris darwini]
MGHFFASTDKGVSRAEERNPCRRIRRPSRRDYDSALRTVGFPPIGGGITAGAFPLLFFTLRLTGKTPLVCLGSYVLSNVFYSSLSHVLVAPNLDRQLIPANPTCLSDGIREHFSGLKDTPISHQGIGVQPVCRERNTPKSPDHPTAKESFQRSRD